MLELGVPIDLKTDLIEGHANPDYASIKKIIEKEHDSSQVFSWTNVETEVLEKLVFKLPSKKDVNVVKEESDSSSVGFENDSDAMKNIEYSADSSDEEPTKI